MRTEEEKQARRKQVEKEKADYWESYLKKNQATQTKRVIKFLKRMQ